MCRRKYQMPLFWFGSLMLLILIWDSCTADDVSQSQQDYLINVDIYLPNANGDSAYVADPHVIKVEDTWYLYGTYGVYLEAWSSKDLFTWNHEGIIWQPTLGSWNDEGNIWAPHVEVAPDGYYLYYTANGRIGLAFSVFPVGPFEEIYDHPFIGGGYGRVGNGIYNSDDYDVNDPLDFLIDLEEYAIDAFVLKANDGSLTFYCSILNPFSVIAAVPMIDYQTLDTLRPKIVLDSKVLSWEVATREGVWIIENEGTFHLMYSGNQWWSADYSVGVARGQSPMGPFRRRADNPILHKDASLGLSGPGHHSVVEGKYNDRLIFFHNRRDLSDGSFIRSVRYMPIKFNANSELEIIYPD